MALSVRRLHTPKDFMALAPVWARLAKDSGSSSLLLSHEWFWCCWHGVWPHRQPEILAVEDNEHPVALIPLMAWRAPILRFPARHLGFLECADSPRLDIVCVAEPGAVIGVLLGHLQARSDWDVVRLQKLPATSGTLKALESALPGRFLWRREARRLWPYLRIHGGRTAAASVRRQPLAAAYDRLRERLEAAGKVVVEEHRSPERAAGLLQDLLALTDTTGTQGAATLAPVPRLPEFFKALTRRAGRADGLSLWVLRLDGRVIAAEFHVRSNGYAHTIRQAADPAYAALSPSSALNAAIVEALHDRGDVTAYEMGVGLADHKLRWGPELRETIDLKIYRSTVYARLLHRMETTNDPMPRPASVRPRTALAGGRE